MVKKRRGIAKIIVPSVFFAVCFGMGQVEASTPKVDSIVVIKSERMMRLMKDGSVVKAYQVALGEQPEGPKTQRGDRRTPEGVYLVDGRNSNSKFYRALHISYPNKSDISNARKIGAEPGGNIMIHGLPKGQEKVGELHNLVDWTNGCIAVTNAEMDEIWRLVPNGIPIEIRP